MSFPKFWPAPMEGVFTESFIRAANELHLTKVWMTSFLRLSESLPKKKVFKEFIAPYKETSLPVSAQLMGRDPELMAQGAYAMAEAGADEVNLNFGCPVPRVIKGRCGGAMLKEITLMAQIVAAVKKALPELPVSVKLRSGFDSPCEMEKIIPSLKDAGTDRFFFHYRTVRELYASGIPGREERFAKMLALAGNIPVVLNGDFAGVDETRKQMNCFQCEAVMLGRHFLSDPGVLRRLEGDSDRTKEEFYYALLRNGLAGEALKGMKRWIFGSWNYELPPREYANGK